MWTSLFVRVYTKRTVTQLEIMAHTLMAYAKFRDAPLIQVNTGKEVNADEYLAQARNYTLKLETVDVKINDHLQVNIDCLTKVAHNQDWRVMRRHMHVEGTVDIRID